MERSVGFVKVYTLYENFDKSRGL